VKIVLAEGYISDWELSQIYEEEGRFYYVVCENGCSMPFWGRDADTLEELQQSVLKNTSQLALPLVEQLFEQARERLQGNTISP